MILALRDEMSTRSIEVLKLEFKRTARNDYFINTCAALGLFEKSISDGSCSVQVSNVTIADELPLKVVLR